MRLTRKFIAALVIGVALVALVQGYLNYERERGVFDRHLHGEATALGRALAGGITYVWQRDGEAAARAFLATATAGRDTLQARWVWLDGEPPDTPARPAAELAPMRQGAIVSARDAPRRRQLTYVPVDVGVGRLGGLEIAQSLAQRDSYIQASLRSVIVGSVLAVLLAGGLAVGLGIVFIGRPVNRLAHKAMRVGLGDLSGPLHLDQRDELGELASEINLMCERLGEARHARELATEQLRHADRLTTVGKLASGLAHELGTPLNVVSGRAKLIVRQEVEGPECLDSARIIVEQADRMTALIRQLLDFARPRVPAKAPLNVTTLGGRVCELVATIARTAGVTLTPPAPDETLRVDADDGQVTQVLTNLVVNAIQATPAGGVVSLHAAIATAEPPPYVGTATRRWMTIAVRDTGTGIDELSRSRMFEPFYTTKEVGAGTGLGLSVSWGIVREHGGWIDVASTPGQGATFTVHLPLGGAA